jgi:glyoxylase I family protein
MVAKALHHVSLNVNEVSPAIDFYEALGFREFQRPDLGFDGAWMTLDGTGELHLLNFPAPEAVGQHFALQVDDLQEALAELATKGISPTRIGGIYGICRQAFLKDPSGNEVELNQPL